MARCDCCGCKLIDDYGTSTITGVGSQSDPYVVTHVDPSFVRPMVRVSGTIGVFTSTTTGVPTALPFTTEVFDTDNMWAVGQPTRIVFQTRGIYLFGVYGIWGGVGGYREISARHTAMNGAVSTLETTRDAYPPDNILYQKLDYQWFFESGDYIEFMGTQTSGGAVNIESGVAWAMYAGRKV